MNVDELTGRELDAWVAKNVMGLAVMRWTNHPEHDPVIVRGNNEDWPKVSHYSTDPAAFMQVQAEMHRRGYWMCATSPFAPEGQWLVGFTPHGVSGWGWWPDFRASGPSLAHAGCLAAAKMVLKQPDL